MRRRIVQFTLLVALGLFCVAGLACSDDSNEICNKIYDECAGALVDDQGGSISQEACIRQLDDLAGEQPETVQRIAGCVAQSACEALATCFQ
jgi:hypothetical protein